MAPSHDTRVPLVQSGVPCVGLGSRSGNLAQNGRSDEWVDVADYERLVTSTALLVERWCAEGAPGGAGGAERKRKARE